MADTTYVLGVAQYEREKEQLAKMGYVLVGYTDYQNGQHQSVELRRVKQAA